MTDYLKNQLIAYIGNKRALLPFLEPLFSSLRASHSGTTPLFLDAFAGSGSVSRLARTLGYEVHANDWEPYAQTMNAAYLTLCPSHLPELFRAVGGLTKTLNQLNALTKPREEFVARWYAPRSTDEADWRTERLFYTRENALWLDAVRERLDELPLAQNAKTLLLALLVYEASVHANTNGVFKAFHKGFGGHGRDALTRILARMQLELPSLWESPARATVSGLDAQKFLQSHSGDVVYLDPPYNQHQYGSNYHLLNTVVRGDRFVPQAKAGIRKDWIQTRSAFCSQRTASGALQGLLNAADARTLIVSYNTEGLVPFDELYELLSARGKVELLVQDYVTYRGGRQSPSRQAHNLEFVLVVDTHKPARSGNEASIRRFLAQKRLSTLVRGAFFPDRLLEHFVINNGTLLVEGRSWKLDGGYRLAPAPDLSDWSMEELARAGEKLERCACRSHPEEFALLVPLVASLPAGTARRRWVRRFVLVLKKFAFRQYRPVFESALATATELANTLNDELLKTLLAELRPIAERRWGADKTPEPAQEVMKIG